MGQTHITTCNNTAGGGVTPGGSNVTGFTYNPTTEVANITTDQPGTFNATIKGVKVENTYFVDITYGDDATAIAGSMNYKYENVDTAMLIAAGISDALVYLMPGTHQLNTMITVSNVIHIYLMPGATLQVNPAVGFNISPAQRVHIYGDGDLTLVGSLFANSSPASAIPAEAHIQCRHMNSSGAGILADVTSMIYSVECYSINDRGFDGQGWSKGNVKTDFWQSSGSKMINLRDFTAFNGDTKYTDYGIQWFTLKGRTRPRCQWYNGLIVNQGIYTEAGNVDMYKTQMYLEVDFDCTDSFFVDHGRGIIKHSGNLIHRKTDTAGNEMPWYFTSQEPINTQVAPYWEHVKGSGDYVSGTHPAFAGSLNNEIFSIQKACTIYLGGRYQNSGQNTGSGAWPIVFMSNASSVAATSFVIFDGEFKSAEGDIAPIKYQDIGNPGHTFQLMCKNTLIYTRFAYSIDSNVEIPIYTYHSLCANQPFNNVINGMSVDNNLIDSTTLVIVPEYGT